MASFLHERKDFGELVRTVARIEKINDPALIEKDYWIMHALFGLKSIGLSFELKGGTSLSKGFGVIHRFSEDIDIRIEPFDGIKVSTGRNEDKPQHIDSRQTFFNALQKKVRVDGFTSVDRDHEFDDIKLRNAGLRLRYNSVYGSVAGLKDGILLEVGFDQTSPHQEVQISSWALDFALINKLDVVDNRAQSVPCYNPEYTFVEKLQTVARKFAQFKETGVLGKNFFRHYYDIHQLLDLSAVQKFIGTAEYRAHKEKRFRNQNQDLTATGAFDFLGSDFFDEFEREYQKTDALYFRGQVPLSVILKRIKKDLHRL